MENAIELTAAIELVVKARKQLSNIAATWNKVDRIASYLNQQLAVELAK
jgi:hypothetical protein